jgi:V/A-type H+-transporting ATPase subunit G/H
MKQEKNKSIKTESFLLYFRVIKCIIIKDYGWKLKSGGENVTLEELNVIKKTEDEADSIVRESLSQSRKMILDEERNSYRFLEQILDEEGQKATELIESVEKKAKEEAKEILEDAQNQSNLVKSEAKENFEKAVDFVIERIVEI